MAHPEIPIELSMMVNPDASDAHGPVINAAHDSGHGFFASTEDITADHIQAASEAQTAGAEALARGDLDTFWEMNAQFDQEMQAMTDHVLDPDKVEAAEGAGGILSSIQETVGEIVEAVADVFDGTDGDDPDAEVVGEPEGGEIAHQHGPYAEYGDGPVMVDGPPGSELGID